MERFEGKMAIVTGGAQGIGEATARRLASEKATVAILDIQGEKAKAVADDIVSQGGNAIAVKMDITNSQEVKRAVKEVEDKLGKIDILVNNVGAEKPMLFIELTEELCDSLIALNLRGHITVTRAVLDGMISRNYGRIVNMSSEAGRVGSARESIYSVCKAGMIAFTKTLARELVRYNILVNCVAPAPTDTPLWAGIGQDNPKFQEACERAIPMRRLGKPEEIAAAIAFLASDDASFITGQTLSIGGGTTMV